MLGTIRPRDLVIIQLMIIDYLPILSVRGEDNGGRGIGVGGYPGTMDGKHHQHHEDGHDDNIPDIDAQTFIVGIRLESAK